MKRIILFLIIELFLLLGLFLLSRELACYCAACEASYFGIKSYIINWTWPTLDIPGKCLCGCLYKIRIPLEGITIFLVASFGLWHFLIQEKVKS